jgi:crotonobetainyl-CoA:carnitine CoA-transferase CaiB-like acyl-CoA transferase
MNDLLSGIRVIEICSWYTGPMTACILADYGAEVIKIEPPGGDPFRISGTSRAGYGAMFMAANRNKRSIVLDLKQPADKERALQLIAKADVVIQNARPGVMERLELDAETLRKRFPLLIYASISGYGATGPLVAQSAFDPTIQALSGMAAVQGGADKPAVVRTMAADKTVPLIAAQAITSALLRRERTGQGCTLHSAMLDAMVWWMWPDGMMNQTFLGGGERSAADIATADPICRTDDGYLVVAPHQEQAWQSFTEIVGRAELRTDSRFCTAQRRMENLLDYYGEIRASFAGKTTEEWCALLRARDVPCAPVLRRESVADYPQVVWNAIIEEVEHPVAGRYRSVRTPVRVDGTLADLASPVPAIGEHSDQILAEIDRQS